MAHLGHSFQNVKIRRTIWSWLRPFVSLTFYYFLESALFFFVAYLSSTKLFHKFLVLWCLLWDNATTTEHSWKDNSSYFIFIQEKWERTKEEDKQLSNQQENDTSKPTKLFLQLLYAFKNYFTDNLLCPLRITGHPVRYS